MYRDLLGFIFITLYKQLVDIRDTGYLIKITDYFCNAFDRTDKVGLAGLCYYSAVRPAVLHVLVPRHHTTLNFYQPTSEIPVEGISLAGG